MDSALGWLGDLVRWIAMFVPRLVLVRATHGGVKFVRGDTREIEPGLHVFWPVTTEVEQIPTARQILSLEQQVLETKDGETVIADAVLVFTVSNVHAFLVENYDAEENMAELAQAAVRESVLSLSFEAINNGRVKLDKTLTSKATSLLAKFGVDVESMKLQSFARGKLLIHAGSAVGVSIVRG